MSCVGPMPHALSALSDFVLAPKLALETDTMASLCRHAIRGQSAVALVRSGASKTKYGIKTGSLDRVGLVPTATAAVPRQGMHSSSSTLQQASTPGQAGSVEAGSAGGESGWTGGDGRDGHTGARTLGIAVFSTLVSEKRSMSRGRKPVVPFAASAVLSCCCCARLLCFPASTRARDGGSHGRGYIHT